MPIDTLANKRIFAESLHLEGLQKYRSEQLYRQRKCAVSSARNEVWFLKNIYATTGKGMYCLKIEELERHNVPEGYIIQSMVDD